ncbi:MAG TPA: outer membrane protein [Pseudolabrys sp.]|nr:outer membrane protein [Pseudolabrys sp.]
MKRFILAACAGLLALAMAGPSLAADLPRPVYKAPAYVAPFSWSGFYVGINGGYGWGTSNWSGPGTTGSVKPKGGLAGGTIGYNMQTGVWVWGVEGDFDWSWMKGNTTTGSGACAGGFGCQTKIPWFATARGRIGYAFDRWLPYITGGAAFADVKATPNPGVASVSKTQVGWTVGAGLEYAFMGAWSAKIEYLYADLGHITCGAATCGTSTTVSYKTNLVRAGLNYRF